MTNLAVHRPAQLQVSCRDTVIGIHKVRPSEPAAELRPPAAASASVAKVTVRLSARRQTATARVGHAAGSCPPHPAEDTNLDRQPGEYDAPSSRVLPGPGLVSTHQPPVPAARRPAVHRDPTPPRARATPRPSRTRAVGRHA